MSLIADALKAAQHEKTAGSSSAATTGSRNFFSYRSIEAPPRAPLPRGVVGGLAGLAGVGVVAVLVTLMISSRVKPQVALLPPPTIASNAPATQPGALLNNAGPAGASTSAVLQLQPSTSQPPVSDQLAAAAPESTSAGTTTPTSTSGSVTATSTRDRTKQPPAPAPSRQAPSSPASTDQPSIAQPPMAVADAASAASSPSSEGAFKVTVEPGAPDASALSQSALAAQRRGDLTRARELYTRALARSPNNADLYNNIGLLYRSTHELDRAEDAYRHAIDINPRFAAAWSNLGVLLDQRGRHKEAMSALQQALNLDPGNADTQVNFAIQLRAAGMYPESKQLLESAVRANPVLAEAHYALAQTLESMGDRTAAIQEYELFLKTGAGRFPALAGQVSQHLRTLGGTSND